ncbi:PREDICTED: uncharacterized protein LOC108378484 [Rhagoletis zephyria]|uniref:uncharacterized protein LOC108378484 n=1 Tax=Rhagoletis zephyria TaxID=28612 RepID=UPI0008118C73|nr:PREDICTED: uncharacterized protein LOC108378484 [Rhagoletis zephyria]
MAVLGITNANDEITQYQMGRYINSNEAVWHILRFSIHERYPPVVHLSVHLENGQRVWFTESNALAQALNPHDTTLTAFFKLCQHDSFARTLLYVEVPKFYTWNSSKKEFIKRKQGAIVPDTEARQGDSLGRVYTIHPSNAECFYLRLLLHKVKGPVSFQALRTVDGVLCSTYRQACQHLGLLENDNHWEITLSEAGLSCLPSQLRSLFAIILTTCSPSDPKALWENHKDNLSEDYMRTARTANNNTNMVCSLQIYNQALIDIENICISINNKSLEHLGLTSPVRDRIDLADKDISREMNYDIDVLRSFISKNKPLLVSDQKVAYETIQRMIIDNKGGLIFLDAPGGTGKTYLLNLILADVRAKKEIAVAVASSGIAATLLCGGRTAHSAFKLPLSPQISDTPMCNISKNSGQGRVLKTCKLIVWDECTMANKKSLEALDRSLRDLRGNDQPMGGALLLLAGDFRQILPVIPKGTAADEVNACLKSSYLWGYVQKLTLSTNMRAHLGGDASAEVFAEQLLNIGNGKIPISLPPNLISFPPGFCQLMTSIEALIENVFPNIEANHTNYRWLRERAILAPKNDNVNVINTKIQEILPGTVTTYHSIDTVVEESQAVHYPVEFLNSLEPSGVPPH